LEASKMIRIGDFSKLSRVSIKTLRFYDEMDLLKPVSVDHFTSYRYYEFNQLPRLHRILALKDLGFSLEEISQLLAGNLSSEQMQGMLKLRRVEIRQRVREETERLERVEVRLRQIEQEEIMSRYDVVIKKVDPIRVASVRGVVPTPPEQSVMWNELEEYLAKHGIHPVGACLTLYHDDEARERDWDLEVCEPVEADLPETSRIKVRTLPASEKAACVIHAGSFVTIGEAYEAIMKWIDANGYRIVGPSREVYVRPSAPVEQGGALTPSQTDPATVTEIQFPVEIALP
jgi:DNA-binding transcriptional MerR regulator